jgi:hypothetical protein
VVKVEIEGFGALKTLFKELPSHVKDIADGEMREGAAEFVTLAKRDAPVGIDARLKGSIDFRKLGEAEYEIFAQTAYAAYMEFGTKGNYRPIPGAEAVAAKFHGKGEGTFKDMVRAIVNWVKRKGIAGRYSVKSRRRQGSKIDQLAEDYAAAWPIIMSILKNGVKAHPYFFKQQGIVIPKMMARINEKIDQLL